MSNTRSPSPRLPPPVHPTRLQNDVLKSPAQLAVPPRGSTSSYASSQTPSPATDTGTSTPTYSTPAVAPGADAKELPALDEEEMSEAQLRQLYDEEEVDRFLRLFSSYIREVRVPQANNAAQMKVATVLDIDVESEEEGASWVSPQQHQNEILGTSSSPSGATVTTGLAEWVAYHIMSYLPPEAPPPPAFTVRGVRLLVHRALVIIFHTYIPLLSRAIRLASWNDPKTSLRYCALYWFLWYHDLLMSGAIVRVAYSLIRRKYLPYPNLGELRQRRKEQDRADDITRQVINRLASTPAEHVKDLWSTFREYRYSRKNGSDKAETPGTSSTVPDIVVEDDSTKKSIDVLLEDDILASDTDLYGPILEIANEVADIHERVRNLFLWRRPQVSMIFVFVLLGMFFIGLLPMKYIVKLVGFSVGVLFWHGIPVVIAMPRRLPPPLTFVPTDAEYAMDVISQRVALGLPVQPKSRKRDQGTKLASSSSFGVLGSGDGSNDERSHNARVPDDSGSEVDWDKWKGRLDGAKALTQDIKGSFKDGTWKDPNSWRAKTKLATSTQVKNVPTHTYPAQCKSPGLITLTDCQLLFTSLISAAPTLTIELKSLTGVKRGSLANGLKVRWTSVDEDGKTSELEERFLWVVGRDDLFARLVGSQSRQWLHR